MKSWINEITPLGDILEIGFGSTSGFIQEFHPKSHTVITLDKEIAKSLPKEHPAICIIEERWQDILPYLGMFDTILYHENTGAHEAQEGLKILLQEKEIFQKVKETFPELATVSYSDQDLDAFCAQVNSNQKEALPQFFSQLRGNNQISELQYQNIVLRLEIPHIDQKTIVVDHLFDAIQKSLKHMRKSGSFSCLIGNSSRYEDPKFFEHFITNPFLDYKEKTVDTSTFLILESLGEENYFA